MPFDFPSNPSIGQPYVVSGITYIFDGVAWNVSAAPNTAVLTANTRNRIRNPNMIVSQENGDTASATNLSYPADQWQLYWSSAVGQGAAGRVGVVGPNGGKYAIMTYVNLVDTALVSEWLGINQAIEGQDIADFKWGTPQAQQAVLRFWVYSALAGTYGGCIRSPAATRTFVFSFTLAAATWTEVVKVIPGDTGATAWPTDNSKAGELWFTWAVAGAQTGLEGWQSSTVFGFTGQTNGFASTSNQFYVTDVGLYKDPLKTGVAPPWEAPDFADELARCQRYWVQITSIWAGNVSSGGGYYLSYPFPVATRVTPTLSGVTSGGNPSFPAASGTITSNTVLNCIETRVASATGIGAFSSVIKANARM